MGLLLRDPAPLLAGRRVRRRPVDDGVLGRLPLAAAASRGSSGHSSRRRRGLRGGFRRLEPLDELFRERRVFLDINPRVRAGLGIPFRVPLRRRSQKSESLLLGHILEIRPPVGQSYSYRAIPGAAEPRPDEATRRPQRVS